MITDILGPGGKISHQRPGSEARGDARKRRVRLRLPRYCQPQRQSQLGSGC